MSSRCSKFPSSSTLSRNKPARCTLTGTKASQCHPRYATGAHLRPGLKAGLLSAKKLKLKRTASSSNARQKIRKPRVKVVSSICVGREAVIKNPSQELGWYKLSQELATKLSPSIVSLASFDGEKIHYKSTGVVVRNNSSSGACVLTSSALVSTPDTERWLMPALKIKLRLPNKEVVDGWIQHYNLPSSMVVIGARFSPDLREACLNKSVQVDPHAHLLAVKRCYYSGKLMKAYGEPIETPIEDDSEGFMLSTCNITMDGSGGPLIDYDGNIVGMNDYHGLEGTRYVPTNKILECLSDLWFSVEEKQNFSIDFERFSEGELSEGELSEEFNNDKSTPTLIKDEHEHLSILDPWPSDDFTEEINDILRSDGYPLPAYADGGMYLKGSFEEEFGTHMRRKYSRKVASMKSESVVALASFNDRERHFACTGVVLDCNGSTSTVLTSASLVRTSGDESKIVDNLRIEVCLPEGNRIKGELLDYDFNYNVATISIPIFSKNHAAISVEATQSKVVALGRVFKSGNLMVTDGLVIGEQDKFDCRELKFSTCKITKAGIGGPLYDLNGNFVGMNFYDTEGTPYLPSNIIMQLLESFDAERYAFYMAVSARITKKPIYRAVSARITKKPIYSWPVPKPCWYYPSHHKQKLEPKRILE